MPKTITRAAKPITQSATVGGLLLTLLGIILPLFVKDEATVSALISAAGVIVALWGRLRIGDLLIRLTKPKA